MSLQYVEPATLHGWLEEGRRVRVFDVRDYDYDEGGHIRGAVNYEYRGFEARLPEIVAAEVPEDPPVYVFHCMRSQQRGPRCALRFIKYAQQHGLKVSVYVLRGGYMRWFNLYGQSQHTEVAGPSVVFANSM
ncbi:Rhodanese domain-containing protein [[Candida] zeylanoides]|jgi:rhodanese-related sulfurtransferase